MLAHNNEYSNGMRHIATILTALSVSFLGGPTLVPIHAGVRQDNVWNDLGELPPDATVEVERQNGERIVGRFRAADDRDLILGSGGQSTVLPRSTVRRVTLFSGNHAGKGALAGFGIGFAAGEIRNATWSDAEAPLVVGSIVGGVGAGIGALVGWAWRKRSIVYDADTVSTEFRITPIETRARTELRVEFTFN